MAKWRLTLFGGRDSLWVEVLKSKYGGWRGLSREGDICHASLWWKDLKLSCGGGSPNEQFDRQIRWKIGEGNQAKFWLDSWLGEETLASKFPRLFIISNQQNELLGNVGQWKEGEWEWTLSWRQNMFEWEKSQLEELQLLTNTNLVKDCGDGWWCEEEVMGCFMVKQAYALHSDIVRTQDITLMQKI